MEYKTKKKILAVSLVFCVVYPVASRIPHFMVEPFGQTVLSIFGTDKTRYAKYFSHWAFLNIMTGENKSTVIDKLGQPIEIDFLISDSNGVKTVWKPEKLKNAPIGAYKVEEERWYYSESPNDSHYHQRIIIFISDCVARKIAQMYFD